MYAQNLHKKMSNIYISINIGTCKGNLIPPFSSLSTHTLVIKPRIFPKPPLTISNGRGLPLLWVCYVCPGMVCYYFLTAYNQSLKLSCVNSHLSCCTLNSWKADSFVAHLFISSTQCLLGTEKLIECIFRRAETFSKRVTLLYSQCHWSYLN